MKRKIIYKLICIAVILMVSTLLNAQYDYQDSYDSIYQIKLDYLEELADKESKDIDELTEFKWFVKWANHFATKLGEDGSISEFGEVIYNYYDENTDVEGEIDFSWEYNSPDGLWGNWDTILQSGTGQGLIISLWIDENDLDHIMAGGQYCGGLWETTTGGDSWENISENEPMIQGVSSIFVNSDSIIYVTTTYDAEDPGGYANGLYYSEDGGENWELDSCDTYNPFDDPPSQMYYYPFGNAKYSPRVFLQNTTNDSIMYLLTAYRLLISTDKGVNWTVLIDKLKYNPGIYSIWAGKQYFNDMVFDPKNDSTIYVTGPEAFRIDNNGQSITNITGSLLPDPTDSVALTILVDAHKNYPDSIWFALIDTTTNKMNVILYNKISNTYTRSYTGASNSVNDLEEIFFVATDRYWMGWEGWNNSDTSLPHKTAFFKVEIDGDDLDYTDLSANLDTALYGGPITGITIELNGSDTIVYITFGNTSSSNVAEFKKKVYYSKDLGETWYAMADGLPPQIPVNDIQYHKESGMLYLVNDVGVYYFDRNDSTWMNITSGLPPMSYSQIRFSHKRAKILVSSHAKGVWEAGLPCFSDSADVSITTNTTWNNSVPVYGNITVDSGAVLTVKKEVYMPTGSKVIVKRGGKLIVDNGKFTHACGEQWKGIEVWGTSSEAQSSALQGWVVVENGGTIEHSSMGIYAARPSTGGEGWDSDYYGGIVQCDSAFFINNTTAVQFYSYSTNSASYFIETTFETNDDYFGDDDPVYFAKIFNMTGIDFEYCTFINNSSTITNQSGVNAYGSSVNFEGECTAGDPCTAWNEGLFKNLNYGIYAYSSTANKYLDVRNTQFEDNFRGLQISGSDGCRVTTNTFKIDTAFATNGGCGLYLNSCTGYWVEENLFYNDSTDSAIGIGLVINSSGTDANEIYRNEFYNLDQGISAQEVNHGRTTGLQILCNDFDDCLGDIFIPDPVASKGGIAPNQGANDTIAEAMAGNLFYIESQVSDSTWDDLNNEADHFYYYYPSNPATGFGRTKPIDFTYNTIDKIGKQIKPNSWTFDDGCPSQISSGGGGGLKSTGMDYKEQLDYYTGKVESMEATLQGLIDGGNTLALNTEVELSTPPETIEIYNQLMGESPFVSETVVETSIEKENVLPNAMIRDVMVSNPHSATSEELMDKLDERNTPMPNYMKSQVLEARETQTLKIELESKLAGLKLKQARALNGIVREYLTDTINPGAASDSLILLFQSVNDKNIKYRLALLHLQRVEFSEGSAVLNAIPTLYDFSTEELTAHNNLVDYYNLVKGIYQDVRTELEVNETEVQQLLNLEESGTGISSAYARNVLIALDEIDYLAPIQLPDVYKSTKEMQEYVKILNTQPPSQISVFPNPSKDYVIVHYNLELHEDGLFEIKDVNGKLTKQLSINRIQDQVTVNTSGWKPGLYIASLKINGKLIESCKFTIIN